MVAKLRGILHQKKIGHTGTLDQMCIRDSLKKEKDYKRSLGKEIEIRTYRPIDKQKEFFGILTAYDEKQVTITLENQETRVFQKAEIALIRLAFDF